MKVFLCPGGFLHTDFLKAIEGLEQISVEGILTSSNDKSSEWSSSKTGFNTWTKSGLIKEDKNNRATPYHSDYEEVLFNILNDPRAHYLMERVCSTGIFAGYESVFNHSIKIEIAVWNSLSILWETKPDRIIVPSTPHSLTWFFVRTAELMGVEVLITAESPLKWKFWVVKGMDEQTPLEIERETRNNQNEVKVKDYIKKIRSTYDKAIPEFERIPLERFRNKEGSLMGELRTTFEESGGRRKLSKLRSAIEKREMLKLYNSLTSGFQIPGKYIVYFLHFQPERTTLPEAGEFVQQWLAIRFLSESLPEGVKLVVREHPSTFRNHFTKRTRDPKLYNSLMELRNVVLAPIRLSPFELIDRSIATSTCTGTVGMESVLRGKPVIVFGPAQYRGLKSVLRVKTMKQVQSAIDQIMNNTVSTSEDELFEYLNWVDRNSFEHDCGPFFSIRAMREALKMENSYLGDNQINAGVTHVQK